MGGAVPLLISPMLSADPDLISTWLFEIQDANWVICLGTCSISPRAS